MSKLAPPSELNLARESLCWVDMLSLHRDLQQTRRRCRLEGGTRYPLTKRHPCRSELRPCRYGIKQRNLELYPESPKHRL